MKKSEIQFALIGAGEFGNFAESVLEQAPHAKLVAVVDTNEVAGKRLADKYHTAVFASTEELLKAMSVDFVMINTPNDTHFSIVKAALQKGVGVFCEKPLVIHKDEVGELFKLANPGQIDVDMVLRESLGYRYLRDLITTRNLKPSSIEIENRATESTIQADWYWDDTRSGGWFYTSIIHFLDILGWLFPDLNITEYTSQLYKDDAGKVCGYEVKMRGGASITVRHLFNAQQSEIGLDGRFEFGKTVAELRGWVPTDITWSNAQDEPFALEYDREIEYRQMVARRLKGFIDGLESKQWRIAQSDVYRDSYMCELFQQAALNKPNQWLQLSREPGSS